MRKSVYRITVLSFAERGRDTQDRVSEIQERFYANTETGMMRHVNTAKRNAMRDAIERHSDTATLTRENNPAENLFAPGYIARLSDMPFRELLRIRVSAYLGTQSLFPWEHTWISVEYRADGFEH